MHRPTIDMASTDTFLLPQVNRMTISGIIAYLMASSTIAGTTAAKAALCRIVFGTGVVAALVSMSAVTSNFQKFFGDRNSSRTG